MRILTTTLAVLAAGALTMPAAAQTSPVTGTWAGELEVPGARLPLIVHIRGDAGGLTATMDSPLQGARDLPVDSVRFEGNRLTFRLTALGASYEGVLAAAGEITGEWRQGGTGLPLVLRRSDPAAAAPRRPQHPEPPFPYRTEEVRFENAAAGIRLAGTLTLPPGTGPFPAVALVSGSGPQDRDETILGHRPFLVLADHLTRAGVAVLRYDDRGVADSEGDFAAATSLDFAGDAAAAVRFLQAHPAIDASRVGLVGHSEGGLIAPLVATGAHGAPRGDVAFTVLLAGPGLRGDSILRLQARAIAEAGGATPEQVRQALRLQALLLDVLRTEADTERRRARVREVLRAGLAEMTPEERAQQGIRAGTEEQWLEAQVAAVATPWFREFVLLDPQPALRQLTVPTLALFGELDLQVPAEENAAVMREALRAAGNADFSIVTLPGLNHLFQTATTGSPAEYATIEETFAPVALEAVSAWILARFPPRPAL